MLVTITTDGGFTGRGIGSAAADADDDLVHRALDAASLADYPSAGRDVVLYTLTAAGRSGRWADDSEIPEALRELFERVWRART